MAVSSSKLVKPAALLLAAQFVHLVVSATSSSFSDGDRGSGEGLVGLPIGALFIVLNIVIIVALRRHREWAPQATSIVGFAVAVGFIAYHGAPFHSWLTNPYWGAAGVVDWLGVGVCLVAGFWCAWAGWPRARVSRAVSTS